VDDLENAYLRWGDRIEELITDRRSCSDFGRVFNEHEADEIKVVIE
jgi:hypothetical protein